MVYVFTTEVTEIPLSGTFALTEVTARSLVFVSGLSLTLVTISAAPGYMFGADLGPIAEIRPKAKYSLTSKCISKLQIEIRSFGQHGSSHLVEPALMLLARYIAGECAGGKHLRDKKNVGKQIPCV